MGIFDFFKAEKERFILCIDGGGMRGIIPVIVLERLEKYLRELGCDKTLASCFDLIAGTSTGGLITLALTCPSTLKSKECSNGKQILLEELEKRYTESGEDVFPSPATDVLGIVKAVKYVAFNKYSNAGIERLLKKWFSDSKMSDASVPAFVVTYDISRGHEYLVSSYGTGEFPVWEAGRATSAAPTYYAPLEKVIDGKARMLADGGVIANNPSLYAYAEAKKLYPDCKKFHILSIGTANDVHTTQQGETNGLISWIDQVFPMYSTAQRRTVDYLMADAGLADYVRIDALMDKPVKMDDTRPESIETMRQFGLVLADKYDKQLKEFAALLCKRK